MLLVVVSSDNYHMFAKRPIKSTDKYHVFDKRLVELHVVEHVTQLCYMFYKKVGGGADSPLHALASFYLIFT